MRPIRSSAINFSIVLSSEPLVVRFGGVTKLGQVKAGCGDYLGLAVREEEKKGRTVKSSSPAPWVGGRFLCLHCTDDLASRMALRDRV